MRTVTVIKRNVQGQETWRYQGQVLEQAGERVVLEAYFDREDTPLHGMLLRRGDRFVETYYTDRWYNVFEIYAVEDGSLRGWYCNIGCPVEVDGDTVSYIDLALDLLVFPDGRQIVLDEDEFENLEISPQVEAQAQAALAELQEAFRRKVLG